MTGANFMEGLITLSISITTFVLIILSYINNKRVCNAMVDDGCV